MASQLLGGFLSSSKIIVLTCITLWGLGNVIFLRGFLNTGLSLGSGQHTLNFIRLPNASVFNDTKQKIDKERDARTFDRLILFIIDGLRVDYVYGQNYQMPFLRRLRNSGKTLSYSAKVAPPTVTLPRIKALLTGRIPGYVDVIHNFAASELQEDNLIKQMKDAGKVLVFYGDEIWGSLFPGMFTRSEMIPSFTVHDLYMGDRTITKHLDSEAIEADWGALILHYTGLDRISHIHGSHSSEVQPKLIEMDDVLKELYTAVTYYDNVFDRTTLIVLTGDHGLADQGGHGGVSVEELYTPLIFMSQNFREREEPVVRQAHQVDIAATVAILLGLAIPDNSIGTLLPHMVRSWHTYDKAEAYVTVANQLIKMSNGMPEVEPLINEMRANFDALFASPAKGRGKIFKALAALYSNISETLQSSGNNYSEISMLIAIGISGISSCLALSVFFKLLASPGRSTLREEDSSPLMFHENYTQHSRLSPRSPQRGRSSGRCRSFVEKYVLIAFHLLAWLSPMSSSLIEEEHFIWYYFLTTVLIHTLSDVLSLSASRIEDVIQQVKASPKSEDSDSLSDDSPLVRRYHEREWQSLMGRRECSSDEECEAKAKLAQRFRVTEVDAQWRQTFSIICPPVAHCLISLCLLRVMRNWNQTGVKWVKQPDIGDWLGDHKVSWLQFSILVSLLFNAVVVFMDYSLDTALLFSIGQCFVYIYHVRTSFFVTRDSASPKETVYEAALLYLIVCLLLTIPVALRRLGRILRFHERYHILYRFMQEKPLMDSVLLSMKLFLLLLGKSENVALMSMAFALEKSIACLLLKRLRPTVDGIVEVSLIYFILGKAFHFLQGNSNQLSTVPVAAGLVGLHQYVPFVSGFQTILATFGGFIYMCLACLRWSLQTLRDTGDGIWIKTLFVFLLMQETSGFLYLIIVYAQRYHLFVWSVFAPKLLYNMTFSLIMYTLALVSLPLLSASRV